MLSVYRYVASGQGTASCISVEGRNIDLKDGGLRMLASYNDLHQKGDHLPIAQRPCACEPGPISIYDKQFEGLGFQTYIVCAVLVG